MPRAWLALVAFGGIALVGAFDYGSGVEYRVFPLYFAPLSLAAWHLGRVSALAAAALATLCWFGANYIAGLRFSHAGVWLVNVMTHATAFATVGVLIATLRQSLERERVIARVDPLTGLLNSRAFYEEAARILALARRHRQPLTMAYLDLDEFKTVNDSVGHAAGDQALRRAAAALASAMRASDVAARIGGDEFVVLLPQTDADGAGVMLERVRAQLAAAFAAGPRPLTASIGAVAFQEPPAAVETLVHEADAVMYTVKAAGKDRVCVVRVPA